MIDVIIPYYNAKSTIARCLSSIAMQTIKSELMVTIVDDCSEVSCDDIIKDFLKILNIRILKLEENRGPGAARQYGIENTHGDFITFIDADDTLFNSFSLEWLYNDLIQDNEASFTISTFIEELENKEVLNHKEDVIWVFGKMYKRSFLSEKNISFLPIRANEDTLFNLECLCLAKKVVINPSVTYIWHWNENSITRNNNYYVNGYKDFLLNLKTITNKIFQNKDYDFQYYCERITELFIGSYLLYNDLLYSKKDDLATNYLHWLKVFYNDIILQYNPFEEEDLPILYTKTIYNEVNKKPLSPPVISYYDFLNKLK